LAYGLAGGVKVGPNAAKTSVLTVGTAVGLEGDAIKASDLAEVPLELVEEGLVALGLLQGDEGVHVGELGPSDGDHLGGGVQLHGARPQRDHRGGQGQVLGLQLVQVAEHLGLRVEGVEDLVGEVRGGPLQAAKVARVMNALEVERIGHLVGGGLAAKDLQQVGEVLLRDGLVQRHTHGLVVNAAEVDLPLPRLGQQGVGGLALDLNSEGVKVHGVLNLVAGILHSMSEDAGEGVNALGDVLEALGPVVEGVHGGHVGEEGLGSANVAGGLLPANVLLPGLEGETEGGVALSVAGHTNQAARHLPLQLILDGKEGGVRATIPKRHTKTLAVSKGNV